MKFSKEIEVSEEIKKVPLKSNLYLIRHGESTANASGDLLTDPDLTPAGYVQADSSGVLLRAQFVNTEPVAIIHTGLTRTIATASRIRIAGNFIAPLIEMPEFRERQMGIYDQMPFSTLLTRNPRLQEFYEQYGTSCIWFFDGNGEDGVEPLFAMQERINGALNELSNKYGNDPVVVIGHSGSIKITRMIYEGTNLDIRIYLSSYIPSNGEIRGLQIES